MNWSENNRIAFGNAVRDARERIDMTQTELAEKIRSQTGVPCNQKKICTIELGNCKRYLRAELLKAICDILALDDEECALAYAGNVAVPRSWLAVHNQRHILTNADDMELRNFLGKYYCVFRSTETLKDELIHCDMDMQKAEDGTCDVTLRLHIRSNNSTKRYVGKFFVNDYYDMCYIILCGNTWQEVCMMIAPRFKASSHENKFFTPLVLTTSAGTTKRPTVHRMLISRKELKGETLELAKSQLLLNNDTIEFSESRLEDLEREIQKNLAKNPNNEMYIMANKFCQIIRNVGTKETVIRIEETDLLDVSRNGGSKISRSMATALVRNYSKGMYHNKISKAGPDIFNTLLDTADKQD